MGIFGALLALFRASLLSHASLVAGKVFGTCTRYALEPYHFYPECPPGIPLPADTLADGVFRGYTGSVVRSPVGLVPRPEGTLRTKTECLDAQVSTGHKISLIFPLLIALSFKDDHGRYLVGRNGNKA